MTTTEILGNNVTSTVRKLKHTAHVSDATLAEQLDITRQVVNHRIAGRNAWKVGELPILADFFGVPVDVLYMTPADAVLRAVEEYDLLKRFSTWKSFVAADAA